MTIKQMVKDRLKEIKELDKHKREKEYRQVINWLIREWEYASLTAKTADEVVSEIMTKQQYHDYMKETTHRLIRNSGLYKAITQYDSMKELQENEIKIQRDYIKKYKIIKGNKNKGERK